jgi:hypothetical protein
MGSETVSRVKQPRTAADEQSRWVRTTRPCTLPVNRNGRPHPRQKAVQCRSVPRDGVDIVPNVTAHVLLGAHPLALARATSARRTRFGREANIVRDMRDMRDRQPGLVMPSELLPCWMASSRHFCGRAVRLGVPSSTTESSKRSLRKPEPAPLLPADTLAVWPSSAEAGAHLPQRLEVGRD